MNAMRPSIRYIAADRPKGIANVQFVVRRTFEYDDRMRLHKNKTLISQSTKDSVCAKWRLKKFDIEQRGRGN